MHLLTFLVVEKANLQQSKPVSSGDSTTATVLVDIAETTTTSPPGPTTEAITGCDTGTGWVNQNGSCYKFFSTSTSWSASKTNCESLGAHLMTIDTEDEQNVMMDHYGML